ncbi:26S proteasome regulatory subunit 4B-like [Dorcoceras hygrometricum]|uniref:26S proteasome regulatory subunit 4B-like n=1 Tax=Dorcoceras hygrometricum TaxID=472368 RepID=A0A2Z7BFM3_9LAMI|nr:26S proteasome regulatory subunit 4B-like [Dorcoceras hygrometricum]
MMNQLKQCQPAASAKERSDEPAGTRIEKLAGEEEDEQSIVDESVSSRKDISTVDESINSRYSRSKKLRRIASWSWIDEEDQLERKQSKLQRNQLQRKDFQTQYFGQQTQATAASSRRAYMNQLLLLNQSQALNIQSTWFPDARKEEVAKRSSRSDKSAAKQLTTYEELSKMDVNC